MGEIIFWWYMLFCELLIPAVMIGFGAHFLKAAPKNINYAYGYRTARSMKNNDTWGFAHKCIGGLWKNWGIALLPVSVVFMLFLYGKDTDTVGYVSLVLTGVQLAVMIIPIFIVESRLKRTFDENGIRKIKE